MRLLKYSICFFLYAFFAGNTCADSVQTRLQSLAQNTARLLDDYAAGHEGQIPGQWDQFGNYVDKERLMRGLKGALESHLLLLNNRARPRIAGVLIIALSAYPIAEDRRSSVGRYVVAQKADGHIFAGWEREDVLQKALSEAGVRIPETSIYSEQPLKVLDSSYQEKLLDEAYKKGVSMQRAAEVLKKHVADVRAHRTGYASSWDEIDLLDQAGDIKSSGSTAQERKEGTGIQRGENGKQSKGRWNWLMWTGFVIALASIATTITKYKRRR